MAIRYSGDVEVRMNWDSSRSLYRVTVRDPERRWRGTAGAHKPPTSETYDRLAKASIERAERELGHALRADKQDGAIRIRRVFQAPCPSGQWE